MEELVQWIAGSCNEIVQVCDCGDETLAQALASKGVRVIGSDPSRGMDVTFALQTYHPQNVLGDSLDDESILEVLQCVCVERFFHTPAFEADWPEGWKASVCEYGVLLEREGR